MLLGGISSLLVGGPVWWLAWKPRERRTASGTGLNERRVYLTAVFGLSAMVAVITLLVIGFRVFEFVLGDVTGQVTGGSLVDRIRAPLGLLVATGLAAGYHFEVCRHDRAALAEAGPVRRRTIGHVIPVTGSDPAPLHRVIDEVTGAGVTVWKRADAGAGTAVGPPSTGADAAGGTVPAGAGALAVRLAAGLQGVTGTRVLVVIGPDGRIDVIPLLG
ncbi:DUF5671 domain-containing protein [Pseudarthrobacter sp. S9]|uniref:DUF5671 domain-containing protein n=1 Tax=Pseudarthrobacter sp. S9 TaxID=3418421 RepID=UPI003D05B910